MQRSLVCRAASNAVVMSRFGAPQNVLSVDPKRAAAQPTNGEVQVKMEFAPMTPRDSDLIRGKVSGPGADPSVPLVAGSEGTGTISSVKGASGLSVGQTVTFLRDGGFQGTWASSVTTSADRVVPVSDQVPAEYRACLGGAPSAALALLERSGLGEGDVLIQNNAASTFGFTVVQLAAAKGIKTINVIRTRPDHEQIVTRLKDSGGYAVVTHEYTRTPEFKRLLSDLPAPAAAFDGSGGASATELARTVAPGGKFFVYSGDSGSPLTLPTSVLVERGLSVEGFNFFKLPREEKVSALRAVEKLLIDEKLTLMVERHDFSEFQEALYRHSDPYRDRKVLLNFQKQ